MSKKTIKSLADEAIKLLKAQGVIVQRYDAYSTNSVYLKLDYGVCNSLRISDHPGKRHLAYRYNLIVGLPGARTEATEKGWPRHYFPDGQLAVMIRKVLEDRDIKILTAGGNANYKESMVASRYKHRNDKGFWSKARIV